MDRRLGLAIAALAASLLSAPSMAQEAVLKAVSGWPENANETRHFLRFVEKVNAEGKGLVRIDFLGGPRSIPTFEAGTALRNGVVQIANLSGAFYTNLMPEADALKLAEIPVTEQRRNGAFELINEIWGRKANMRYLARIMDHMPFHLYVNRRIDGPHLKGMKIRVSPTYRAFVSALGGTPVQTSPGEVHTALERGMVDGYAWTVSGIFEFGWHQNTRYRIDPGFYLAEIGIVMNLDSWNRLSVEQKRFLEKQAAWAEDLNGEYLQRSQQEEKRQADAGIQTIRLEGAAAAEYRRAAYSAGWAEIIQRSPVDGARLRELIGKP